MMTSFPWLPDAAWRGALLLALAFVVARLLRSQPAAVRHVLWTGAIAGVMAMPLLSVVAPARLTIPLPSTMRQLVPPPVAQREAVTREATSRSNDASGGATRSAAAEGTSLAPVVDREPALAPAPRGAATVASFTPGRIMAIVWLMGAALMAARLLFGFAALRRLRRRARALDNPAVRDVVAACAARMGTHATPELLVSDAVAMPCTTGWLTPVVLLPDECLDWPPERFEVVLLHELGHIRRMDIVPHLLGEAARVLYWFNPLVWLAAARLRAEAESATDERVVHAGTRPSEYAAHLLDIVQRARPAWHPAPVIPLARRSEFEGRILAILDSGGRALPSARRAAGVVAVVAGLSFGIASMGSAAAGDTEPRGSNTQDDGPPAMTNGAPDDNRDRDVPGEGGTVGGAGREAATDAGDEAALERQVQAADRGTIASALAAALRDPVAGVREAAAQALGNARDSVAVRALSEVLLNDQSAAVRRSAAWSLGEIDDPAAIPALTEALARDRDITVRKNAAEALGHIDRPQAAPALIRALEGDAEAAVRLAAAEALAEIEDSGSIEALMRALDRDDDPDVRRAVIEAIDNLEDARAVAAVSRALRDPNVEVRRAAADALGSMDDRAAVAPLMAAAGDANAEVRRAVLDALGQLGDRRATATFAAALADGDVEVRRAAAQGLGNLDYLRTAPAELLRAMSDTDAEVRHNVAHALANIEDPAAVPVLIARIGDADVEVRRAVVDALDEFDDPAVVDALRTALQDADPEVRESAARALGNRSRK